jgi:uridylate kinase
MNKSIVIKIGGSVLYDEDLNVNFEVLEKLKKWYKKSLDEYSKIVIVVGGGNLSRMIQEKVSENIKDEEYLHQVGMSVTQISANITAGYLDDREIYIPRKLGDAYEYLNDEDTVRMVSGGLKTGWSTDMDAVVYADILHLDRVFKISNVDYLYDSNPKDNPEAKPILDYSWDEYFKLFHITGKDNHEPNSNIPIDPLCANFADMKKIGIHFTGGRRLEEESELENLFQGGTYIHP